MKKFAVLTILFILPFVVYLFFASGVHNFARLPILTNNVQEIEATSLTGEKTFLKNKITILGFLGSRPALKKGNVFNLNQEIYKRFYEFTDFQLVMLMPEGAQPEAIAIQKELSQFTDTRNWKFLFASEKQVEALFQSLNTPFQLDAMYSAPYVFIIDKEGNLRGRNDDEDTKMLYGFDASSPAELTNKMVDDVKVMLAEYRLALKKNKNRPQESLLLKKANK